jgi:hypothetical protein
MHDKSLLERLCLRYFPGNDVISTELLIYRSLIGYRHGGGEIYKVELWEALFEGTRFCCVWLNIYRVFNGRKALLFTLIFHQ